MKRNLILIILSIGLIQCQNQKSKGNLVKSEMAENISYSSNANFDLGSYSDGKYQNDFFGFSLSVSSDWKILNGEDLKKHKEIVESELINKDISLEAKIENSKSNWFTLLTLEKNGWVPYINFMAENIDPIPNVENAVEYLKYTKFFMTEKHSGGYPKYSGGEIGTSTVGNRDFLIQTFTIEEENGNIYYQKTYSAQFDTFLLNIITNYQDEYDLNIIEKTLDKVKWKE